MTKMQGMVILMALILPACSTQPQAAGAEMTALEYEDCGTFDLEQLDDDLRIGYFDRAGIEMAKAVLVRLKLQLECERRAHNAPLHRPAGGWSGASGC